MTDVENAETSNISGITPVLGIKSYEDAVAHYVDWLGFNLDWEWREAPGRPVIMAISRDDVSLMLNESPDSAMGSWITLGVTGIQALADEWNGRRSGSATVVEGPPYEILEIHVTDSCGNRLVFQQQPSAQEKAEREARRPEIRSYIRQQLSAGASCPTPAEVVEAIGGPIGMAMEILCEFPEYEQATRRK